MKTPLTAMLVTVLLAIMSAVAYRFMGPLFLLGLFFLAVIFMAKCSNV